jgi:hypothetical protein
MPIRRLLEPLLLFNIKVSLELLVGNEGRPAEEWAYSRATIPYPINHLTVPLLSAESRAAAYESWRVTLVSPAHFMSKPL